MTVLQHDSPAHRRTTIHVFTVAAVGGVAYLSET
jgi:hypothetical protein